MPLLDLERKYRRLRSTASSLMLRHCYNRGIVKLPYLPLDVIIEPTAHCNLKCIICSHHEGLKRPKGFMDMQLYRRIIEQVRGLRPRVTLHFGGEPLLHKNLADMVRIARGHGCYTRIHTNATLLTDGKSRELLDAGLDELSFSFDGSGKEDYERIRAGAKYEATLENITRLLSLKKARGSSRPYTILQKIAVDGTQDMAKLRENEKAFDGLPIDEFKYIPIHNWAGEYDSQFVPTPGDYSPCFYLWYRMVVTWDGLVISCCNDMEGKIVLGDLNKEGVRQIWNGERMMNLRKQFVRGEYSKLDPCRDCDAIFHRHKATMKLVGPQRYVGGTLYAMHKLFG